MCAVVFVRLGLTVVKQNGGDCGCNSAINIYTCGCNCAIP